MAEQGVRVFGGWSLLAHGEKEMRRIDAVSGPAGISDSLSYYCLPLQRCWPWLMTPKVLCEWYS